MIIWIDQLDQLAIVGKVEPTIAMAFSQPKDATAIESLMAVVAERAGYGYRSSELEGLSSNEETEIELYVSEGYRDFLLSSDWSFTKPVASSVLWNSVAASASGINTTTLSVGSAEFFPTMVGRSVVFDTSETSYEIDGYRSATSIELASSAGGETALTGTIATLVAASTVTATAGVFSSSDVDGTITFADSGSSFTIWSFISDTQVVVTGDATGELTGDTFSGAASGTSSGVPVAATQAKTSTAILTAGLVGKYLEFDATGSSYLINSFKDTTNVSVVGDATAESASDTFKVWDTFAITATGDYRMPDDFGGLLGDVYYVSNEGRYVPLENTGVAELLWLLQASTATGRPQRCAIEAALVSGDTGQRFELKVQPIPDRDYTVKYQYQVLPDKLTTAKYPYGGAMHAETLKYACLAAMERNKFMLIDGPYQRNYSRLLQLSIRLDQRGTRARSLGILVDARPRNRRDSFFPQASNITVGGASFP